MKDILLGNCDFAQIRDPKNNYLYIDKTKFLYDIIKKRGEYYFLSRPRRFGKSLTISTLEKIFEGRRDLFKGLAIDKEDYDWQEYPVIHIDWSNVEFDGEKENLKESIKVLLSDIKEKYSVKVDSNLPYNLYLREPPKISLII